MSLHYGDSRVMIRGFHSKWPPFSKFFRLIRGGHFEQIFFRLRRAYFPKKKMLKKLKYFSESRLIRGGHLEWNPLISLCTVKGSGYHCVWDIQGSGFSQHRRNPDPGTSLQMVSWPNTMSSWPLNTPNTMDPAHWIPSF